MPRRDMETFIYEETMSKNIKRLLNQHVHIDSAARAALYRTGVLDTDLLSRLGLQTSAAVNCCPVVAVEFLTMAWNKPAEKMEPLFTAKDVTGKVCGVYYPGAFKSLTL